MAVTTCWSTWALGLALFQEATGLHCKEQKVTASMCVSILGCWVALVCDYFLTEDSISKLCVCLPVCEHISISHSLLLLVAGQQQVEADWEGLQSEADQVCPGNHFFIPAFFTFLYPLLILFLLNYLRRQMYWWPVRKHTQTHTLQAPGCPFLSERRVHIFDQKRCLNVKLL